MTAIELTATQLRDLITPVLPLASDDITLPILNAVLIRSQGAHLTATATDRFRLGMQRIKPDTTPPAGFTALVSVTDLRHILAVFKATKKMNTQLQLTTGEDAGAPTLTVEAVGGLTTYLAAKFTYRQVNSAYPDVSVDALLRKAVLTPAVEVVPYVALNPHFVADFKAASRVGNPMRMKVTAPDKPVSITVGDDFIGILMPIRPAEGVVDSFLADDWSGFFTPDTETEAAS